MPQQSQYHSLIASYASGVGYVSINALPMEKQRLEYTYPARFLSFEIVGYVNFSSIVWIKYEG